MPDSANGSEILNPLPNSYFLKKSKSTSTVERQLFIDEALFLSRVNHPHIVKHLDCGVDDIGNSFIKLEQLHKVSVVSDNNRTSQVMLADSLVSSLNVLDFLAFLNLSHGDLKPEHIMFNKSGKCVIIDFAQVFSLSKRVLIGTSAYLAPELFWNYGYTLQSDMFSLGLSFLRMGYQDKDVGDLFLRYESSLKPWSIEDLTKLYAKLLNQNVLASCILKMISYSPLARPISGRDIAKRLIETNQSSWSLSRYDELLAQAIDQYSISTHWVYLRNPLFRTTQKKCFEIKECHGDCKSSFNNNVQIISKMSKNLPPKNNFRFSKLRGVSICKKKYFRGPIPRLFPKSVLIPGPFKLANVGNGKLSVSHLLFDFELYTIALQNPGKSNAVLNDLTQYAHAIIEIRRCTISRHNQAGLSIVESLLELDTLDINQKLTLLSYKAYFLTLLGFASIASSIFSNITNKANEGDSVAGLGEYFSNCGACYFLRGDSKEAIVCYLEAVHRFDIDSEPNPVPNAILYNRIATAKWITAGTQEALESNDRAMQFAESSGEKELQFSILLNRSMYLGDSGNLNEERIIFATLRNLAKNITSKPLLLHYLHNYAAYKLRHGDYERALLCIQEACRLSLESGLSSYEKAHLLSLFANVFHSLGNLNKAIVALKAASRSFRLADNKYNSGKCYQNLAELNFIARRPNTARRYVNIARQLFVRAGYSPGNCDLTLLKLWYSELTDSEHSELKMALSESERLNYTWGRFQSLFLLAIFYLARSRHEDFRSVLSLLKECSMQLNSLSAKDDIKFLEDSVEFLQRLTSESHIAISAQDLLRLFRQRASLSYRENKTKFLNVLTSKAYSAHESEYLVHQISKEIEEEGRIMSLGNNGDTKFQSDNFRNEDMQKRFKVISEIASLVDQSKNVDEYISSVLELTVKALHATRGAIFLVSRYSENIEILGTFGCQQNDLTDIENISKSLLRHALGGNSIFIRNTTTEKNYNELQSLVSKEIKSAICIPLRKHDEVFGAVYIDTLHFAKLFDDLDKTFLDTFGAIISGGISASYRLQKLNTDYQNALNSESDSGLRCSEGLLLPSTEMQDIYRKIFKVAPLPFPVLILGQTGSGKDVLAKMVHENSQMERGKFIALNCSAIPTEHLESELFGVAEKAFTNVSERRGKLELADGGTLFLDEIAEMPLTLQAKLLRVIEGMEFERLGGSGDTKKIKFRLISATNKNLKLLVSEGKFREDLYHRINDVVIQIPDLSQRSKDIQVLVQHYHKYFQGKLGVQCAPLTDKLVMSLCEYNWPGGIRELSKVVSRLVAFSDDPKATLNDLPDQVRKAVQDANPASSNAVIGGNDFDKEDLLSLLRKNNYNIRKSASEIGVAESTLRFNLKKLNIEPPPKRFRA